ncbi:unnamed protein product [Fraxinus pennsylvanica]|uniref:Receptor ligand binding region domain-containing protein n=1 Tax=Fraxinus pennsylvanica TaxID=56036 RepID=A0AAD1YYD8_9LAMI|nr:unnamed protein product [Fraxinus pennsylvanica]
MYGFLPCSKSSLGHLFLIIVYEYLLFHGESYVASGGERIFKILGPGVFGASIFQVIGSLPEALILLASGLLNSKETAQECVQVILGPRSWVETSIVAEVIEHNDVPILSFADSSSPWAAERIPFLDKVAASTYTQMKAVANIIQSWGWRRANVIYEDTDSAAMALVLIYMAYDAMQTVGLAMNQGDVNSGRKLLKSILKIYFNGLSGKIQFMQQKLEPATQFQIINIIGKEYRELGFGLVKDSPIVLMECTVLPWRE